MGDGVYWEASIPDGAALRYWRIEDESYRQSPDWRDQRRRCRLVGQLIRRVRGW